MDRFPLLIKIIDAKDDLSIQVDVYKRQVFTNGAIANGKGEVFIYYASSDTRMHVATTTIDKLVDYVFHTPSDPGRSVECVAQRWPAVTFKYRIRSFASVTAALRRIQLRPSRQVISLGS